MASSASWGADVPKPCLSRPGRQRNIRVFDSPGSLLCSGWLRLAGVENQSWLGPSQLPGSSGGRELSFPLLE